MRFAILRQVQAVTSTSAIQLIAKDVLTIGSGTNVDLRFDDPTIARLHATLRWQDGSYFLSDERSLIGTYLNGERISRAEVGSGDRIEIGDYVLELASDAPEMPLAVSVFLGETAVTRPGGVPSAGFLPVGPPPDRTSSTTASSRSLAAADYDAGSEAATEHEIPILDRGSAPPTAETPPLESPPAPPEALAPATGYGTVDAPAAAVAAAIPRTKSRPRREIDYLRAYGLRRPWLSLTVLTLGTVAAAIFGLSRALGDGRREALQPGPLSQAHQTLAGPTSCNQCHASWEGVDSGLCQECHEGAVHNQRQTRTPDCIDCHIEHRLRPSLAEVGDRECTTCHRQLELADGQPARFDSSITAFWVDHRDFAVTLAGDAGGSPGPGNDAETRLPLSSAIANRADPARVAFGHALHLDPQRLATFGTNAPLACIDCHRESPDNRRMTTARYQEQCSRCHPLNFGPKKQPAPHESPERVAKYILATYAQAAGDVQPETRQQRLKAVSRRDQKTLSLDKQVERNAVSATEGLFGAACDKCHELRRSPQDLLPEVVATRITQRWFPHAEFSHSRHERVECETCHPDVRTSSATADVLLRGIDSCLPCHRGEAADPRSGLGTASATTDCVLCHVYHPKPASGRPAATAPPDR